MTNEERIKAMSTEELARGIKSLLNSCIYCPAFRTCTDTLENKSCLEKMEEWLKEEAEEWKLMK